MRYQPHTKKRYVFLEGSRLKKVPIRTVRDTLASHSLILGKVLPEITPNKKIRLFGLGGRTGEHSDWGRREEKKGHCVCLRNYQ